MKIKRYTHPTIHKNLRKKENQKNMVKKAQRKFHAQFENDNIENELYNNFYKAMKKYKKMKINNKVNIIENLILKFIKTYNKYYKKLQNFDKKNNTNLTSHLVYTTKQYKFDLDQIGIKINNDHLLVHNNKKIKSIVKDKPNKVDFLFEKDGLISQLYNQYKN